MTQFIDIAETTSTEDFITIIDELANQAAEAGYYGLQDACLLIMEALNERLEAESPELSDDLKAALQDFPSSVAAYLQKSQAAAKSIASLLRHTDLNIPLIEDEQIMIAQTLVDDIAVTDSASDDIEQMLPEPADTSTEIIAFNTQALENHLAMLEHYADHAATNGQYGLQDVCLLVIDAINTRQQDETNPVTAELLTVLDSLPTVIVAYQHEPQVAIEGIFKVLGHPQLNIQLNDDEITMLESMLTEGIPADQNHTHEVEAPSKAVTPATLELVELLVMEAQRVDNLLAELRTDDTLADHLERLTDELDRYINAANIAGFSGLAHICEHIQSNINHFYQDTSHFTGNQRQLLQDWIDNVKSYLSTFTEDDAGLALIAQLSDPQWPLPLTPDTALEILGQIRSTNLSTDQASTAPREQFASEEDVSLRLPDDVNQELLDILLQELPVYTQEFSEAIHHLQQGGSTEDIDIAQRIAHTLKGSANTVGIGGIATITHHLEDILEACAKANRLPSKTLVNMLIDAADCLEAMSDFLIGQSHEAPAGARQVLQEVLDFANQIDQHGLQDSEDITPDTEKSALLDRLSNTGVATESDAESTAEQGQQSAAIRVPSEQIDALLRMSGESLILNSQANERLRRIKNQLQAMDTQFKTLQRLSDELEQLIDIKDLTGQTLNKAEQEFDSLEMDQYNELYTTSRRLIEAAFDAREMNFDARNELEQMGEVLEYQQRLVIDTQGAIMQTRLVPVASIASRLQRTLRQTCRLTGKHSTLTLSGEHLMIDSDVLNSVIDPLMHILRNAVDHGLEGDAERMESGKPAVGNIALEFDREGNNILVRCRDDGRGLDFTAIRQAATARGVIQPDQDVTEEELKRFILRPNFSTRTESTQTSGRGVGMNAVHFQVLSLGGTLALHSKQGQGLTVELRMPLPISRSHTLLAMAGSYRVAIASKGLKQILYAVADDFFTVDDKPMLRLDDVIYPVTTLNKLLRVAENRKKNQRHSAVLLIEQDEKISAVVLDSIIDSLDIVIKDFGHYIKKIPGYIGAAIMGDGAVAPVLDVPELLRLSAAAGDNYAEPIEMIEPGALLPKVLVVDDSLSQRRSLEQLLSDAGFAVHIARDGMEAVELLADFTPDIMLTDLEMPRMNGIELTAHVRTQTRIKTLPIIMITSRTTQKHHKMAEDAGVDFYIAKPVREDDLLSKIQHLLENKSEQIEA
ncbi:Gliding motility regulatory protein FrzE [Crenothrix polyspora]|uniref:Chemotaxis protein CheA n=1 Tax=Crenothrix polyspora TaxID=360316 RepID=A0A1R4HJB4_9GAMM|nr:response regulator [Crenothrix polyspora]SJM96322.1 Gliding motility regulatory protein FrzE [Crenothrix polyspora]